MKKIVITVLLTILTLYTKAQVSTASNHSITSTDYCGWDNTTLFDLNIEHQGTYNINFLTGGTTRMTINGTAAIFPGYVGIGTSDPQTLLHICGDNIGFGAGWRNWMIAGTFSNASTDMVYVGMKNEGGVNPNRKDAIIAWGDDLTNGLGKPGIVPRLPLT